MSNDSVSLAYELAEVEHAVRAARLVVELLATDAVPEIGQERRVALAAAGALHLIEARVHLVARVVRGDSPVAAIAVDHNRTIRDGEDAQDAQEGILRSSTAARPRRRDR